MVKGQIVPEPDANINTTVCSESLEAYSLRA
jgi:hypothetical protein